MLGILLIYWIGKYFYQLAEKFNQNKWLYAILGIVVFYAAQLFFGILLGVGDAIFDLGINFEENLGLDLLGIPIGALACNLFYELLDKVWKRDVVIVSDSIQDIGNPEIE